MAPSGITFFAAVFSPLHDLGVCFFLRSETKYPRRRSLCPKSWCIFLLWCNKLWRLVGSNDVMPPGRERRSIYSAVDTRLFFYVRFGGRCLHLDILLAAAYRPPSTGHVDDTASKIVAHRSFRPFFKPADRTCGQCQSFRKPLLPALDASADAISRVLARNGWITSTCISESLPAAPALIAAKSLLHFLGLPSAPSLLRPASRFTRRNGS